MDFLSWILIFTVVGFTGAVTFKMGKPLYRYHKAKDRVIEIVGRIAGVHGEESIKRKGITTISFYPVYECEVGEAKKNLNSVVQYFCETSFVAENVKRQIIGREVVMLYDRETGEVWCKEELPRMAKQITVRVITVVVVLTLMIITSILL